MDTAKLLLLSRPGTWRLRHASRRLRFRADAVGYRTRTGISRAGQSFSVWAQLLKGAGASGVMAIALTAAVEAISRLLRRQGATGPLVDSMGSSSYESLLLAVAGFGATILGLYFTALSVVISTTYAEAPSSVRRLVAQDQAGTIFARSMAGLVVVSVSLVTAGLFGVDAAGLTLALVGVTTAFSILALLRLSVRTFSFFDPVRLSPPLLREFKSWTERASAGGLRWSVPSFQDAYRRNAQQVLTTFRELIDFTGEVERADITDLRSLGQRLLLMWARYAADKTSVPVGSLWFERTYRHPDWFLESATSLHMALATNVGLSPRSSEYGDPAWAERQMSVSIRDCVGLLLDGGHRQAVVEIVQAASTLANQLGRSVQVSEGTLLLEAVSVGWDTREEPDANEAGAKGQPAQAEVLAVLDALCLIPINLLLGFADRCSSMDASSLKDKIDSALTHPAGPFSSDLPIEVVTQLDQLKSGLDFERAAEGRQVTPDWWLHHMAARHTLAVMYDALVEITDLLESAIVARAEELASTKRAFEGAVVGSRGLEASHKLSFHLQAMRATFEQLDSLRVVDDEFWPEANLSPLEDRADRLHDRIVDVIARITPMLGLQERDETLPDLFGQGHAVLIRETFDAIVDGDPDRFRDLWPSVFSAGLLAYERTRRSLSDHHDQQTAAIYLSELLADLFELSGYALLRSKLDGHPYWDLCLEQWNQLFDDADAPESRVETMMAFTHLRASTFAILPRDTIRSNRQQRFRSLLAEQGLVGESLLDFDLDIDHPSAIVRAFARGTVGLTDAIDLFVAEYLSELPGAGELPHHTQSLKDSIARERSEGGDIG